MSNSELVNQIKVLLDMAEKARAKAIQAKTAATEAALLAGRMETMALALLVKATNPPK